ncbi:hypothetical protein D516_0893 [Rhodobacter sp. AKP1]|nr:hypothetical protein D516_0893 [Rhodobacter sp. AKP1]
MGVIVTDMGVSLGRIFSILPERRKCSVIPFRQKGQKRQRALAVIIGAIPQAVASPELALKAPTAAFAGAAFAAELESITLPEPPPAETVTAGAAASPVHAEGRDPDGDPSSDEEPVLFVCDPVAPLRQIHGLVWPAREPKLLPVSTTSPAGEDKGADALGAPGLAVGADAGLPREDCDPARPPPARHRDPPAEPAVEAPPDRGREAGACPPAGLNKLDAASPEAEGPPDLDRLSHFSSAQPVPAASLTGSFPAPSRLSEMKTANLPSQTAQTVPRRDEAAGAKDPAAATGVAAPSSGDGRDKGKDLPSSGASKMMLRSVNEAVAALSQTEARPAALAPTVPLLASYPAPPVSLAPTRMAPTRPPAVPLDSSHREALASRVLTATAPARLPSPVDGSSEQDGSFRARVAHIVSMPPARSEPKLNLLPRKGATDNLSDTISNLGSWAPADESDAEPAKSQPMHASAPSAGFDLPTKLEMSLSKHAPLQLQDAQPAHLRAEKMPAAPPVPVASEGVLPAAQTAATAPRDVAIAAPINNLPASAPRAGTKVPAPAERGGARLAREQTTSGRQAVPENFASLRPEPQSAPSGETQKPSPEKDLATDLPVPRDPPPSGPVVSEPRTGPDPARPPAPPVNQTLARTAIEAQSGEEDAVEVVVQPDELGRVKMTVAHDGGHVRVLVQADRTDTLDMMRRNSGDLGVEMRQAGFLGASLSFGGREGQPPPQARSALEAEQTDTQPPTAAVSRSGTGLDLRI